MGYINDFRAKLTELIEDGGTEEAVKFAADKVLESYRNGAGLIEKADHADAPTASAPRGERQAPRSASWRSKRAYKTPRAVEPDAGRHYQTLTPPS